MVISDSLRKYYTCPARLICGCESFLLSRFLICKHIIRCYKGIEDAVRIFGSVQRQPSSLFWVQQQPVLHAEFQALLDNENRNAGGDSAELLADLNESELAEDY